jgi:hypothetical protein
MLQRNLSDTPHKPTPWQELAEGAPTILAFAQICSQAMVDSPSEIDVDALSVEAKTILALAAQRGTLEIRAHRDPFDSVERFLAVCVEVEHERRLLFLQKEDPQQTVKFLEGFRQLCRAGLVLHHLHRDFSLSTQGFVLAKSIDPEPLQHLIKWATELD